jgi:hypothetical protein
MICKTRIAFSIAMLLATALPASAATKSRVTHANGTIHRTGLVDSRESCSASGGPSCSDACLPSGPPCNDSGS